jgi:hypothetical protein
MQNHSTKRAFDGSPIGPIPDLILPSQFFELAGAKTFSSEQRLMLAVLTDAINILGNSRSSTSRRKRKSFGEAWSWVFAKDLTSPMSFEHVCDALGVNAEGLRRRMTELFTGNGGSLSRLRLKQVSREQGVTLNRDGRRKRRAHRGRSGASVAENDDGATAGGIAG